MPRVRFVSTALLITGSLLLVGCAGMKPTSPASSPITTPSNSDTAQQSQVEYSHSGDPVCKSDVVETIAFFEGHDCGMPHGERLVTANLNHDGYDDVVEYGSQLVIMHGSRHGTLTPITLPMDSDKLNQSVAIADFNGDGIDDIATCVTTKGWPPGPSWLELYVSDRHGRYHRSQQIALSQRCVGVAAGDVNGDGKQDAVVAMVTPPPAALINFLLTQFGDGKGHFPRNVEQKDIVLSASPRGNTPARCELTSVVAADFDGDGVLDTAIGGTNYDVVPSGAAFFAKGDGTGHFSPEEIDSAFLGYSVTRVADLNHDGRPDLIVNSAGFGPHASSDYALLLAINRGPGVFSIHTIDHFGAYGGNGRHMDATSVADFDADGIPDALISYRDTPCCTGEFPSLEIWTGGTDLASSHRGYFALTNSFGSITAGDFNGDGKIDFVGTIGSPGFEGSTVKLFLNRGD